MKLRSNLCAIAAATGVLLGGTALTARAGLWDAVTEILGTGSKGAGEPSQSDVSKGLLEALRVGAERAVAQASSAGGFLDNPLIRIPLPPAIQKVSRTLRSVGLGGEIDKFETTLNRGAEKAASRAMPIFGDAIRQLTFQDVERIWKGGDTAATEYFRGKTSAALSEAFLPVVHEATQAVGVTRAYDALAGNPLVQLAAGGTDLDHYVNDKALDGLFTLLAAEEKKIRTDPLARSTELLKKVFGNN